MTLIDWMKLNPNRQVLLTSDPCGVRATLKGGSGIDQRLVGKGASEQEAIAGALQSRDQICSVLP